jgi:hypothetical protein
MASGVLSVSRLEVGALILDEPHPTLPDGRIYALPARDRDAIQHRSRGASVTHSAFARTCNQRAFAADDVVRIRLLIRDIGARHARGRWRRLRLSLRPASSARRNRRDAGRGARAGVL